MTLPRQNSSWVDDNNRPTRDFYNWARTVSVANGIPTEASGSNQQFGFLNMPKSIAGLENGKCFSTTTGFTIEPRTTGDICSVYNNSSSSITITQGSGVTLRVAGTATTGNYTLPQRGFITLWYHSEFEVIIL